MLGMAVSIGVTSVHVFTCEGFSIQRILPNSKWQEEAIPVLQSFFLMTTCYQKCYLTDTNQVIIFKRCLYITQTTKLVLYLHNGGEKLVKIAHTKNT